MSYSSWSVVFGEQPSAAKWNILGTNDADFNTKLTRAGMVVQSVATTFSAVGTGTTTIPADDTIPQNTEGTEFMTRAITPISSTNQLIIEVLVFGAINLAAGNSWVAALFQDTTADALAAGAITVGGSGFVDTLPMRHVMTSGTTSATTFKVRVGPGAAGTFTFNGASAARLFGAITKSSIRVTEIVV